jgi:hypothetical protein
VELTKYSFWTVDSTTTVGFGSRVSREVCCLPQKQDIVVLFPRSSAVEQLTVNQLVGCSIHPGGASSLVKDVRQSALPAADLER